MSRRHFRVRADAATIVDWTYYYGKDLGTSEGKLAFVEDVDDDAGLLGRLRHFHGPFQWYIKEFRAY